VALRKEADRLLFDLGVVNTTDDEYEQQILSVALCLQQLTAPSAVFAHILYCKPEYLCRRRLNAAVESAMPTS